MDNIKNIIGGGIITLVIGGTAFTFSEQAVVDNFERDTGLTEQQAEEYVNSVTDDDLASFEEIGNGFIEESETTFELARSMDCLTEEYEWETAAFTCEQGKSQLMDIGRIEFSVGRAYINLHGDEVSNEEVRHLITEIDNLNQSYKLKMSQIVYDEYAIEEFRLTNSYNKSLLQAALDSQ